MWNTSTVVRFQFWRQVVSMTCLWSRHPVTRSKRLRITGWRKSCLPPKIMWITAFYKPARVVGVKWNTLPSLVPKSNNPGVTGVGGRRNCSVAHTRSQSFSLSQASQILPGGVACGSTLLKPQTNYFCSRGKSSERRRKKKSIDS